MINFNPNIQSTLPKTGIGAVGDAAQKSGNTNSAFADTVKAAQSHLDEVNDLQKESDISIKDLLSGKNEDITSVVSTVAKADMSFKLLVGVRNKLIEAYKQTMNMPL